MYSSFLAKKEKFEKEKLKNFEKDIVEIHDNFVQSK